jgi:hypothetical protein
MTKEEVLYIANRRGKSCYDLMLEVYKELESRTCESCVYYDDIYCTNLYIDSMVDEFDELTNFVRVFKNFSCNKWESKE